MSFEVRATTEIDAPIEVVWRVLTDLPRYAEWSTLLKYEGGELAVGAHLRLRLELPGGGGYAFAPEVLVLDAPTHFAWVGRTGIKGVFDGEHHFRLRALESGRTVLENVERYSGILSPIMQRMPQMKSADAGFEAMNQELRQRAEALARAR